MPSCVLSDAILFHEAIAPILENHIVQTSGISGSYALFWVSEPVKGNAEHYAGRLIFLYPLFLFVLFSK